MCCDKHKGGRIIKAKGQYLNKNTWVLFMSLKTWGLEMGRFLTMTAVGSETTLGVYWK